MKSDSKILTGVLIFLIIIAIFVIYILKGTDEEIEDDVLGFSSHIA